MRNYQRMKNNKYYLPSNLYRRMLYLMRDYDRLRNVYQDILYETPSPEEPTGIQRNRISDPVTAKVVRREKIWVYLEVIDQSSLEVPECYRGAVLAHLKYGEPFPCFADRKTWFSWQAKLLYSVAAWLGEI